MYTIEVSEELAQEIQLEAETRGLDVEEFLKAIIRRERTLANRRKIEQEQAWWLSLPLTKRARYEGDYVAVHNQSLVDHDSDEDALHRRIRATYGNTPVLIMPAEGPREIRIISPRSIEEQG